MKKKKTSAVNSSDLVDPRRAASLRSDSIKVTHTADCVMESSSICRFSLRFPKKKTLILHFYLSCWKKICVKLSYHITQLDLKQHRKPPPFFFFLFFVDVEVMGKPSQLT